MGRGDEETGARLNLIASFFLRFISIVRALQTAIGFRGQSSLLNNATSLLSAKRLQKRSKALLSFKF
jgi:hypothetical protein